MGICTNRLLMGQPLIALFISAKRHGSSLLRHVLRPTIIAKKENRSSFDRCWHKPAVERQAEHVRSAPAISDINLFRYSRALPQRRRTLKCDEHGARLFLLQEMRRLACVPTKNENRNLEGGSDIRENGTIDGFAGSAVTRRDCSLIGSIQQSRLSSNLTRRTLSCCTQGYRTGVADAG